MVGRSSKAPSEDDWAGERVSWGGRPKGEVASGTVWWAGREESGPTERWRWDMEARAEEPTVEAVWKDGLREDVEPRQGWVGGLSRGEESGYRGW